MQMAVCTLHPGQVLASKMKGLLAGALEAFDGRGEEGLTAGVGGLGMGRGWAQPAWAPCSVAAATDSPCVGVGALRPPLG